jgi:hypothetical protein
MNDMNKEQIAITAIALMRDAIYSEVESLGGEIKSIMNPAADLILGKQDKTTEEVVEMFRATMIKISEKMIDFVDAMGEVEKMADSALEGLGHTGVTITALTVDENDKKIVGKSVRKGGKAFADPKYKKGFSKGE